jgi:putative hemolysin
VETTTEILVILCLILLNGFFAGAEIAVLTARRNRLQTAADEGSKSARAALALLQDTSRFLSTVQVGITGVSTFAAAFGGVSLVSQLAEKLTSSTIGIVANNSQAIALTVVTGSIAFTSLVLGELVPKRFALVYAERLAQFVALPMLLLSIVARPAVVVLGFVTSGILRLLGANAGEGKVSVDDIEHLIETGKEQGVLEATEHEVALEALQLRNRRVRDIMRPRMDIDAIDIATPTNEVVGAAAMSGFSRLPVYEGNLDRVLGFLYNKDLFQQFYLGREIDLRSLLREPLFIPENLTLDRLLLLFQERRTQLAVVLDEFGGTRGMVTFEDILEELVGEIHDEYRQDDEQRIIARDDRSWLVDGQLPVHELVDHLPVTAHLGEDAENWSTVSGLVIAALHELPHVGDRVASGDVQLEVVDMDGKRVDRILVSLQSSPNEGPAAKT